MVSCHCPLQSAHALVDFRPGQSHTPLPPAPARPSPRPYEVLRTLYTSLQAGGALVPCQCLSLVLPSARRYHPQLDVFRLTRAMFKNVLDLPLQISAATPASTSSTSSLYTPSPILEPLLHIISCTCLDFSYLHLTQHTPSTQLLIYIKTYPAHIILLALTFHLEHVLPSSSITTSYMS